MKIYIGSDRKEKKRQKEGILKLIRISSDFTNLSSLLLLCKYVGTEQIMFHNLFTNIYTYCSSSFVQSMNILRERQLPRSTVCVGSGCFYVTCVCVYVRVCMCVCTYVRMCVRVLCRNTSDLYIRQISHLSRRSLSALHALDLDF